MLTVRDIMVISRLPRFGRETVFQCVQHTLQSDYHSSDASDLMEYLKEIKQSLDFRLPTFSELELAWKENNQTLEIMEKIEVKPVGFSESLYPQSLFDLEDYPLVLFYQGNLRTLHQLNGIGVVGTRIPSPEGIKLAAATGSYLARRGYSVISGLAAGCDSLAHRGCLDEGGYTVACLPFGHDQLLQGSGKYLGREIVEQGGLLLSEYSPGGEVHKRQFIERNRLISGLSRKIIVIETGKTGGTLHTVRFAHQQGKPVGCWHPVDAMQKKTFLPGNRDLVKNPRNIPIQSITDLDRFIFPSDHHHH